MAITINIDSQNVVQTSAEWALDTTVYSDLQILFVSDLFYGATDQMQFKKADGVQTFADLDFMPIGSGGGSNVVAIEYTNVGGSALNDLQDYFVSAGTTLGNTVNSSAPEPIPAGTVIGAYIATYNASTFGTSEDITLTLVDKDNNDLGLISNTVKWDTRNNYYAVALNFAVTDINTFIRIDVPAMVTNPTSAKLCLNLLIELP